MPARINQLDGLRAVAFLAVFLHHLGYAPAGWLGVDVFFVLSGFLVTAVLRKRRNDPDKVRHFYASRVRRIMPPYIICLAFCAVFFTLPWAHIWFFYVLPLENLATVRYSAVIAPIRNLWSLAIEEQFYLIWPLMVFRISRKYLLWALSVVICGSPIFRALLTPHFTSSSRIYYSTIFRLDTICAGAFIALIFEMPGWKASLKRHSLPLFLVPASTLVLMSYDGVTRVGNSVLFNSMGYTLAAIMSVGLLLQAMLDHGLLYRVLMFPPLRMVGRISYMGYLMHLPILLLVQRHRSHYLGNKTDFLAIPLTLLFASASWFAVERPIMEWKRLERVPQAAFSEVKAAA